MNSQQNIGHSCPANCYTYSRRRRPDMKLQPEFTGCSLITTAEPTATHTNCAYLAICISRSKCTALKTLHLDIDKLHALQNLAVHLPHNLPSLRNAALLNSRAPGTCQERWSESAMERCRDVWARIGSRGRRPLVSLVLATALRDHLQKRRFTKGRAQLHHRATTRNELALKIKAPEMDHSTGPVRSAVPLSSSVFSAYDHRNSGAFRFPRRSLFFSRPQQVPAESVEKAAS